MANRFPCSAPKACSAGFFKWVTLSAVLLVVLQLCARLALIERNAASQSGRASVLHGASGGGSGSGISGAARCPLASCSALTEEEAAAQRPPRYSTFTCVKGTASYGNWQNATCVFHNLCLNATTLRFEYYVDPSLPATPLLTTRAGKALFEFPEELVDAGWLRGHVPWRPDVVRRAFPQPGPRVKWAPSPQALLYALCHQPPYVVFNFGHILYNIAVPLFNMQHLFGIYTPKAQPLILPGCEASREQTLRETLPRLVNTARPEMSLMRVHWDHDMAFAADYAAQVLGDAGDGLVCFRTALVGTGPLHREVAEIGARHYRDAAVWRLGLQEEPQQRPVITVLQKRGGVQGFKVTKGTEGWLRPGRRNIENVEEVVAALQARYGSGVSVKMVECCDENTLTVHQQIELMSDTSILISPGGGLASILNFLRPSATAIPLTILNTNTNLSQSMDDLYYTRMEYPRIEEFPVTITEYEGTTDMPGCKIPETFFRYVDSGELLHCNIRFGPEGMLRLMRHVDRALMHWAERTGRYKVLKPLQRLAAREAAAAQAASAEPRQ